MRMLKIKKKVFEKEVLDIGMKIVILDICEITADMGSLVYDFSRMYWILPTKLDKIASVEKQPLEIKTELSEK